jgi:hypothetical protein
LWKLNIWEFVECLVKGKYSSFGLNEILPSMIWWRLQNQILRKE